MRPPPLDPRDWAPIWPNRLDRREGAIGGGYSKYLSERARANRLEQALKRQIAEAQSKDPM